MEIKSIIMIIIFFIALTIAGISFSSYGLGNAQGDRSSSSYQTSSIILTISIILCVIFIISLVIAVLSIYNIATITGPQGQQLPVQQNFPIQPFSAPRIDPVIYTPGY